MLRGPCMVSAFGGTSGRPSSTIVVVRPVRKSHHHSRCLLRPGRLNRLSCNALDNRGSQQSSVTSPGSDAAVMPFEITGRKEEPLTLSGTSKEQAATAVADAAKSASASWESWLKVFEQMDQAYEQQELLKVQLKDAVRHEQYSRAASLKQQLSAVQSLDAVASVQSGLAEALKGEQYEEAARLRDQGMAWMQGWWRGVSDNDSVGHLMHVAPEFGRYTGRVYTARDLADLAGLRQGGRGGVGLQQLRSAMQPDSSSLRDGATVGSPALEVFVVQQGGENGELAHQVVSLVGASPSGSETKATKRAPSPMGSEDTVGSLASMLGLGLLMRLSVTVNADGGATLSASPVDQSGSSESESDSDSSMEAKGQLVGWDAVEAKEQADEEPNRNSNAQASASKEAGEEEEGEVAEALRALTEGQLQAEGRVADAQPQGSRVEGLNANEQAMVSAALDSLRESGLEVVEGEVVEDAGQMVVDVRAARAVEIDATGPDDEGGSDTEDDDDGPGGSARGESGSGALFTELHRAPAELERLSVDQFMLRMPHDSAATAAATAGASSTGRGEQPAVRFEILVPAGRLMSSGSGGRAGATVAAVAERVARAQARRAGRPVDPVALRAALQTLLRALEAGKAADIVIPSNTADSKDAAAVGSASSAPAAVSGTAIRYSRVPPETGPKSDPFSGLYVGSFGPHGPELLRLRRLVVDGEEVVEAVKVTGDANVPAGKPSFRAKIGRKHKQSAHQVYPDELGVTAHFKGQGHVAGKGYSRPKWVEGELLVFSSSSALTNGAQLGFVWHVPGERKFLILLNKVDLTACAERGAAA